MAGQWQIRGSVRAGVDAGTPRSPLQESFVEGLSRWASGTAVVAVRFGPTVAAMTATSFASVSLDPPLVLVCVGEDATVLPFLDEGERFAVSILAEDQRRLASLFADRGPLGREHFPAEGDPIVADALAGLGCTVRGNHPAGDHRIVVGEVDRVELGRERPPLLYYRRSYHSLGQ
jgi:flavin reductase (NADH)